MNQARLKKATVKIITIIIAIILILTVSENNVHAKTTINKTNVTLCRGNSKTLIINNATQNIIWHTSNKAIATVSSNGKVVAKKVGSVNITATTGKVKLHCKVIIVEHDFSNATCKKIATCSRCKKTCGTYAPHKYKKTIVPATKSEQGYTLNTCKYCGDTYKDSYTDYQVTEERAYADMLSLQTQYPEGMEWTNDNYYQWEGGIYSGGYGCYGFAFILSDAAFGYLPAHKHTNISDIKIGDILRINTDTHSVIVLERYESYIVIAEGNYNSSIHWGRVLSYSELSTICDYILTRYPE